MQELHLGLYSLFGMIETIILLLVAAGWLLWRSHALKSRLRGLQNQLNEEAQTTSVDFPHYLREEIRRNQALCEALDAGDAGDQQTAEHLSIRHQFLELEVAAQEFSENPVHFQTALSEGVAKLLQQWPAAAASVTASPVEPEADPGAAAPEPADENASAILDTHDNELDRLKQVILNQQDAMSALRSELQTRASEIENLDSILNKLDEFERHDVELQRCLQMLEQENKRLKQAREEGGKAEVGEQALDSTQLNGLKTMIGNQHETITHLQSLIQELAPEAGKAAELEAAIAGIQRANQELSGCVAVLEDENALLRTELEAAQAKLEQGAEPVDGPELAVIEGDSAPDLVADEDAAGETYQLEVKIQELEALVEFKDAALAELEKQYHSLEARYQAVSGEK